MLSSRLPATSRKVLPRLASTNEEPLVVVDVLLMVVDVLLMVVDVPSVPLGGAAAPVVSVCDATSDADITTQAKVKARSVLRCILLV